jgi:hypothetical protein
MGQCSLASVAAVVQPSYRAFSFYYDWIGEMIGDGDVSSGLFINGFVAIH